MTDRAEWWAHAGGGLALAALALWLPPLAMALFLPLFLGWVRESEQARKTPRWHRPSAFWHWSSHRVSEWLAWEAGALVAVGAYSGLRAAGVV